MTPAREILLGRDGARRPVVFVAMPTGQVLANLLVLFELAEPGDRVLWLATADAVRLGWLDRSEGVLAQRCPEVGQEALRDLGETLDGWGSAFATFAGAVTAHQPVMVTNGGTKLLNHTVAEAFRRAGCAQYPVTYASTLSPAGLMLQPDGHGGRTERIAYGPDRFPRLREVLAASGHRFATDDRGRCLWRAGAPIRTPPAQPYGNDPAFTFDLHERVYQRIKRDSLASGPVPNFEDAELIPAELGRLRNAVNLYLRRNRSVGALGELYNSFRKVAQKAANRHRRAAAVARAERPEPEGERLAARFEAAVAGRVMTLLATRPDLAELVGEVWRNVKIVPDGSPDSAPSESDVLILMRHGAALALERKSGLGRYDTGTESLSKDVHAREYRLGRFSSKIARLVVCLPMFREALDTPWQAEIRQQWQDKLADRHKTVFFTLPGDPGGPVGTADGALHIPSFDTELAELMSST